MQIQHILKGLLASVMFTVTLASPMNSTIQESGKSTKRATGVCNGTSCYIDFLGNAACAVGSCTSQSGAGDGATCWEDDAKGGRVTCPGCGSGRTPNNCEPGKMW